MDSELQFENAYVPIVLMDSGRRIVVNFLSLENILPEILFSLFGKVTSVSSEQSLNTPVPNFVTLSGKCRDVIFVFSNARVSILCSVSGNITVSSELLLNA